ncbi:MAG: head-tail connector protein [Burkholderiales bacterium]|jgi:hypothetical protein|nr:head-tail connector protein [Burkholderiales bacterium]
MLCLAEVKAHLRVDHNDEDSYINGLIAAAVSHGQRYTGCTFYKDAETLQEANDRSGVVLDDDLRHGLYLLVGHWYNVRETVIIGTIVANAPLATSAILDMYRRPTL